MKQIGSKENPHVVQLYEVLASRTKIYLVLELVTGGELFDKIVKETRFTESKARFYFRQLVTSLEFCHNLGVCHRDLKPENLLIDDEGNLKISDFGLSALYTGTSEDVGGIGELLSCRANLLHTTCGTPNYVAPEVLEDKGYDVSVTSVFSM
jgi:5'-AMP-activated protein kinase catalytic alpha subunit